MIDQYMRFFINGGILGLFAWGLQLLIYNAIGSQTSYAYAIATALTYIPLVIINFMIQKSWIFKQSGVFWRFVLANLTIMTLVSILSPICKALIDIVIGMPWGNRGGFLLAALVGSIPSFLIKRYWVFKFTCNQPV